MEKGGVVLVRYNFDGENGEIGLNLSSPNNLPTLDSQLYFIKGDSNVFQLTSKTLSSIVYQLTCMIMLSIVFIF